MGTFLAMKYLFLFLAFALVACGPKAENTGISRAIELALSGRAAEPEQVDPEAWLNGAEGILMALPTTGWGGLLKRIGQNGDRVTWAGMDERSVTTQSGIVVATRGMGFDLYSADVDGTVAALAGGPTQYQRRFELLEGDDDIARAELNCTFERVGAESVTLATGQYDAIRYKEVCLNDLIGFENAYWLQEGGKIIQSQQWISPNLTHLTTQSY